MSKRELMKKRVSRKLIQKRNINRLEMINNDKEQRRATRLGAIIAISAVVGTACGFLFKVALNAVDILPQVGLTYGYVIVLCCFTLAIAVITFLDILTYVLSDLKRYNVADDAYEKFDKLSDENYLLLVEGFKRHMCLLLAVLFIFIPISAIYGSQGDRWTAGIVTVEVTIFVVLYFYIWMKKTKKDEKLNGVKKTIVAFFKGGFVAALCFIVVAEILISSESILQIDYNEEGQVIISNESSQKYKGMDIAIQDSDEIVIYTAEIKSDELLWAQENKYVKNEGDGGKSSEGIVVSGERLYWRHIVNVENIVHEDGSYVIAITVYQDEKYVIIKNAFIMKNGEYIFSKERITKEY